MEIIYPYKIGDKIIDLISKANEKFIAITPYIEISHWETLLDQIKLAKDRRVEIVFFFRGIEEEDYFTLNNLNVEMHKVKRLHAKMFFNESSVIVSSMNLYESANLHSIDFGILYSESRVYNEFYNIFLTEICGNKYDKIEFIKRDENKYFESLFTYLTDRFPKFRLTKSETYIFSKDLVPPFHIFIKTNEITLKLNYKSKEYEKLSLIDQELKSKTNKNISIKIPSGGYVYYTWDINTEGMSLIEFVNVISEIRDLYTKE